ncbi:translation elongation factor Ts [secondary endosymbiont of Ctenarytaina eucalypti]|uniref:Elongation factor Ts n=1 Tax=secondary endosymbiont of Ctenarytaina eucalypti TaxID=1199245 RepID=J3TFM8_9ENTR|nr:translation elongation factor Ts [secondary endosymbiont of Ctenarytaina eucalypti]AFP85072.1 translation elongation factor Ts [secondary endosymbiont of Ctenarytaina eucalypti]
MPDISAALVKDLRERTGAGIMECKQALVATKGNIELAIDNMRQSGTMKAAKKAGRIAAEGLILNQISPDGKYGVIIELNCETDFVTKDKAFRSLGEAIITFALKQRIPNLEEIKARFEEKRIALVARLGENISIRRMGVLEGQLIGSYLHGLHLGVIVSGTDANEELLKQVAMHIAASNPEYMTGHDVPADMISREHKIQLAIAMQSGKKVEIAKKMVEGRMRKFIDELSLTGQQFVMEPSKTVGHVLNEHGARVNHFLRFEVGEGIQKAAVNFAAEVAEIKQQC